MEKEFYMKLRLQGVEYNALELEELIFRAIMLENPTLPYEVGIGFKHDITITPIEYYDQLQSRKRDR